MLMFGLFFVLYFVKLLVAMVIMAFRLDVLYRMSHGSSPLIPFCFFLFLSFFLRFGVLLNLIESTCLKESTFTNKGQRDETCSQN